MSEPGASDFEVLLRRQEMDARREQLGSCKRCGEPVLWWRSQWGVMIPLDPVPVAIVPTSGGPVRRNLFALKTRNRAACVVEGDELFRVHNDGACIDAQRAEESTA